MKFPNGKVFKAALREYAVKKPMDIKFKLNEKTKVSVHCKYECSWRVYASQMGVNLPDKDHGSNLYMWEDIQA